MEIDIKDLEGVTLLPLGDGRVAYVDKSGSIYVCGIKEELAEQFETSFVEGDFYEPPVDGEQDNPEFILADMFPDQRSSFVLTKNGELIPNFEIEDDIEEIEEDPNIDIEETNSAQNEDESVLNILQAEDDCVEQVTMFKCKACSFTAPEKSLIVQHFSKEHVNQELLISNNSAVSGKIPVSEEFERLAQSVAADSVDGQMEISSMQETEAERLLYLCAECQNAFESIELCKEHMIQEHKFVSGKGKAQTKLQEVTSMEDTSASTRVTLSAKNTITTVMDVEGMEVMWRPLELLEAPVINEKSNNQIAETDSNIESGPSVTEAESKNIENPPDVPAKPDTQKFHEKTRKIKCTFRSCISKFSNEKALQIHLSCHSKNSSVKEFHCIHCDEKFVRWRLCSAHLWRVHKVDVDLLSCPVCLTYKAATPLKIEIHLRTHGDSRPYCCNLCPKSFKQSAQLRNHCTSVHFDKKIGDANPRWYMEQQCTQCGKTYSNSKGLKRHIQAVHSKMKPYVCSVCGHSSACRAMLTLHMRQHTGEKPHACTHCDYRAGDHNTLRRHMMQHTGQRQYHCPHCPYTAIQSNCYKAHLRNRHPGESGFFSCTSCTFQTVNQDTYVQHIADHQKGLIAPKKAIRSPTEDGEEIEYFPGNVAAAHLVYRYLGSILPEAGHKLPPASITDSRTSADGTTQSITIQIPSLEDHSVEVDDDESSHSFLLKGTDDDVGIDTGGITIPADPSDLALVES